MLLGSTLAAASPGLLDGGHNDTFESFKANNLIVEHTYSSARVISETWQNFSCTGTTAVLERLYVGFARENMKTLFGRGGGPHASRASMSFNLYRRYSSDKSLLSIERVVRTSDER